MAIDRERISLAHIHIPPSIARLLRKQGRVTEAEYLAISENWLLELTDGVLEILEFPTLTHQRIVADVLEALQRYSRPNRLGEVLHAPLPVRLRPGKYREPDIMFTLSCHADRI